MNITFIGYGQVGAPLAEALSGKVLVDCTNPVGPGLQHGLGSAQSGALALQGLAPAARVVKAFTIHGFENLERHAYPGYGVKPVIHALSRIDAGRQAHPPDHRHLAPSRPPGPTP